MKQLMHLKLAVTFGACLVTAAQADYVGNSLTATGGQVDGIGPFVILGEYNPAGPSASSSITLPTGTVQDVKFYGGNYDFTLYALAPVGSNPTLNEQTFQVVASETFSGSAATGVQTLAVSGFSVTAGDLLAFAGTGPYYLSPGDTPGSDATYGDAQVPSWAAFGATAPAANSTFTVGASGDLSANYDYVPDWFGNQGRTYEFGVDVCPAPDSGSALLLAAPMMALLLAMKRNGSFFSTTAESRAGD